MGVGLGLAELCVGLGLAELWVGLGLAELWVGLGLAELGLGLGLSEVGLPLGLCVASMSALAKLEPNNGELANATKATSVATSVARTSRARRRCPAVSMDRNLFHPSISKGPAGDQRRARTVGDLSF